MRFLRLSGLRVATAAAAAAALSLSAMVGASPATASSSHATRASAHSDHGMLISGMKYTVFDSAQKKYARAYSAMGAIWPVGGMESEDQADAFELMKVGAPDRAPIFDGDSVTVKDVHAINIGDLGKNVSWSYSHIFERMGLYAKPDTFKVHLWDSGDGSTRLQLTDITASSYAGNSVKFWDTSFAPAFTLDSGTPDTLVLDKYGPNGPGTPGSYSTWKFDTSDAIRNIDFRNTVVTSPGDGNVFWSNQFGFDENSSYIGFQDGLQHDGQFLWSIWSDGDLQFKDGTQGSHCWNNTGEGQHLQCSNSTVNHGRPITGHSYDTRVEINPSTHWAKATVTDETAKTSFVLGEVLLPKSQKIMPSWNSWVEYFDWNRSRFTCNDGPYSKNHWGKPTGNNGTLTASNTSTYSSDSCQDMVRQTKQDDGSLITELGLGQSARLPYEFPKMNHLRLDTGSNGRGLSEGMIATYASDKPDADQLFTFARDGSMRTAFGGTCPIAGAAGEQIGFTMSCNQSTAVDWHYDAGRKAIVNDDGWAMTAGGSSGDPVTARPYDGRPGQIVVPVQSENRPLT